MKDVPKIIKKEDDSDEPKEKELSNEISKTESPFKLEKSPEITISTIEELVEQEKPPEKFKLEPIIIEKRKLKKIDRPKVNIFLEDSDEVDEFENTITLEVKSKWSSPEPVKQEEEDTKTVPESIENRVKTEIPVVVESPELSPIVPIENIFESSTSMSLSKSPTPLSPASKTKGVKNVCSFLSDISEGYLSGISLSGLYSGEDDADESIVNLNGSKDDSIKRAELNHQYLSFVKSIEPDTTAEKLESKSKHKESDDHNSNSDSDSDDSDSSSSSDSSDSSSSSSEEEDSSDDTSDEETNAVVNRFSGFGHFDSTSLPIVSQIPTAVTQNIAAPNETITSRFQPHQSIIRPPGLLTNLTKPPLYTPAPCISSASPFLTNQLGQAQFPIPFKIYSLRDAGNSGMIFPSAATTPTTPQTPSTPVSQSEKEKDKEKAKEREKRTDKRDRHRSRSHSREKDRKKYKDERKESESRRKTPPKRRTPSPKRRSSSPTKRKHSDDKRDVKRDRRDFSPRHNSHSSRSSHNSR